MYRAKKFDYFSCNQTFINIFIDYREFQLYLQSYYTVPSLTRKWRDLYLQIDNNCESLLKSVHLTLNFQSSEYKTSKGSQLLRRYSYNPIILCLVLASFTFKAFW